MELNNFKTASKQSFYLGNKKASKADLAKGTFYPYETCFSLLGFPDKRPRKLMLFCVPQ